MTITLYNNSSANNVVHKQMTALTTLSGTLKENVNMERVVVTIPYFANYSTCNYAYIPEFHRYYYVSVDVLNGQRLKLTMESDPLTSFYSQYAGSQVIAKRSMHLPPRAISKAKLTSHLPTTAAATSTSASANWRWDLLPTVWLPTALPFPTAQPSSSSLTT